MHKTHGLSHTRSFNIWLGMKQRCENPNNVAYRLYGGRGIKICTRWQTFEGFFADMGHAPDGKTIDRKDNNLGYEPSNCRWATTEEQSKNTRRNRMITHGGVTLNVSDWARKLDIVSSAMCQRIKRLGIAEAIDGHIRRSPKRGKNVSA